jgi:hypothetical protein
MSSYGYYIDESAWDEMADTYAAAGSKEITGAGVYIGPERIRTVLKLRGPLGGRTPNFFTIHTQGLGGASSANRFASGFPPDRPIRARQYAFPEISEPAFHYRNPVSGREPRELLP